MTAPIVFSLSAMTVLREVAEAGLPKAMLRLLLAEDPSPQAAARAYGDLLRLLLKDGRAPQVIFQDLIRYTDHPLARACARGEALAMPMRRAALHDLRALNRLARMTSVDFRAQLAARFPEYTKAIEALPSWETPSLPVENDEALLDQYSAFWRGAGYGDFARYHVFALDANSALHPVIDFDPVQPAGLIGYARQRESLMQNTRALLQGKGAAHALLYGDKGTGKSSTVKAVANALSGQGLRMITLQKAQIKSLPALIASLADNPLKFILFLDDLSFSDIDDAYTALKAIIEGGQQVAASNVVLYVTSNRRHLVRETFTARAGDEAHLSDTLDEASSLADRFGLTLTYLKLDRAGYLEMIEAMAQQHSLPCDESYRAAALAHAVRKGGYTPRIAQQFTLQKLRADA